jgi:hypothetical protein
MHPCSPGAIGCRGEADDLAELADRLALGDGHDRHLVAARYSRAGGDAGGLGADIDRIDSDRDIVGGIELQRARRNDFVEHDDTLEWRLPASPKQCADYGLFSIG